MGHVDVRANAIGAEQLGLAAVRQLRASGVGHATIRRRVAEGTWGMRLPGVVDLRTHRPSWWQSARALLLAAGGGGRGGGGVEGCAVLSHDTAAVLHALPDAALPRLPDVLVPRRQHAAIGGVRLHTTVRLRDAEVTVVDGWPVTSGARTVVDCAPRRSDDWLQLAIGQLLRRGATSLTEVVESATLRPGAAATGRVLRAAAGVPEGIDRSESVLEVRGLLTLARLGLLPPAIQHEVRLRGRRYRFDAAWPARRVAVEFDGAGWHDTEIRSGADAVKDGSAAAEGWQVVRLRWWDVLHPAESAELARLRTLVL